MKQTTPKRPAPKPPSANNQTRSLTSKYKISVPPLCLSASVANVRPFVASSCRRGSPPYANPPPPHPGNRGPAPPPRSRLMRFAFRIFSSCVLPQPWPYCKQSMLTQLTCSAGHAWETCQFQFQRPLVCPTCGRPPLPLSTRPRPRPHCRHRPRPHHRPPHPHPKHPPLPQRSHTGPPLHPHPPFPRRRIFRHHLPPRRRPQTRRRGGGTVPSPHFWRRRRIHHHPTARPRRPRTRQPRPR